MESSVVSNIKENDVVSQKIGVVLEHAHKISEQAKGFIESLTEPAASCSQDTTIWLLLTIFVLACFVGYYVVWHVTPALQSPLMSVSNAISGIVIVGALLAAGVNVFSASLFFAKVFGLLAVFFASINIFGGFVVSQRMLAMFKKKK
ncbi:MAG: NAD(P) transhydrogenase subunit alpha [Alphaproteobacteria bacterium]